VAKPKGYVGGKRRRSSPLTTDQEQSIAEQGPARDEKEEHDVEVHTEGLIKEDKGRYRHAEPRIPKKTNDSEDVEILTVRKVQA
jgi:hypothetical protein